MKICHEADGAVCADAIAELRCGLDGDVLAPADSAYIDARDRWESAFHPRPVVVSTADSDADFLALSRFARELESSEESGRAPILIVPGPPRPKRSGRSNLLNELERFVAAGQPELAAERLISAILTAGLAATFGDSAPMPSQPTPVNLVASNVLTRREREVARLIAAGRTNRSIADELFIAQSTVERHVANILNKLGFNSRTQIAAWAVTNGLASAA